MKVILQESYMSLGEAGDLIDVKNGYARNFLIPQKIAVSATPANIKSFADRAKEIEKRKLEKREESTKLFDALDNYKLVATKKVGEDGRLYGAVSAKDIEGLLTEAGHKVDRRMLVMGQQIKAVGEYPIMVKLVGGKRANLILSVEAEKTESDD